MHSASWRCTLHCWLRKLMRRGRIVVEPTAAVGRHGVPEEFVVPRLGGIVELWLGVAVVPGGLGHLQPQVHQWLPDLAQRPGTRCRPSRDCRPGPQHCRAALLAASVQCMLSGKEAGRQPLLGQPNGRCRQLQYLRKLPKQEAPQSKASMHPAQDASQAEAAACLPASLPSAY